MLYQWLPSHFIKIFLKFWSKCFIICKKKYWQKLFCLFLAPSDSSSLSPTDPSSGADLDASNSSLTSTTNYVYASFPVDVVVYIRVQPSMLRLSCLPLSRVECLLRLPSLDLVFSTKRSDVEGNMLKDNNTPFAKPKGISRMI